VTRPDLSIVIPSYNEAERLVPTLEKVMAWALALPRSVEVLVVDDGSRDTTREIAREFMNTAVSAGQAVPAGVPPSAAEGRRPGKPRLRLVENGRNRGKGYSVRHGVRESEGNQVLFSDADLSTPIEDWALLDAALASADVAIGSRALSNSRVTRHQPRYREAMGRIFNRIVQRLAVSGIQDTQCGFKLFRGDVAREIFARSQIDGFAFDVEVLHLAQRAGYRIAEVAVTWENDERTRVHPIFDSARMFRDVVGIRVRHAFAKRGTS
jgi:dolichyl-phosphate beta-glucosyltransferase